MVSVGATEPTKAVLVHGKGEQTCGGPAAFSSVQATFCLTMIQMLRPPSPDPAPLEDCSAHGSRRMTGNEHNAAAPPRACSGLGTVSLQRGGGGGNLPGSSGLTTAKKKWGKLIGRCHPLSHELSNVLVSTQKVGNHWVKGYLQ